jgi:hypothetical protein
MPFDGSGNYVPPGAPTFPAVAGNTIVSTYYNAVINDISVALTNCLTRDGQGKPSAAINWNGQNLTGVGTLGAATLTLTGALTGVSAAFTGAVTASGTSIFNTVHLVNPLTAVYGGTGINASAAANGKILIGNGAGFTLANITAGAGITVTNGAGTITIAATGGGGAGTTSFPLTLKSDGTGAAALTTFDGSVARSISWNSIGAKPDSPRIQAVVSAATVTPTFSNDQVNVTAQAANLLFANPTGTAIDGWEIIFRIKDNGTARIITFDTQYRAIGSALPTTTTVSKTMYIGMKYNAADTKWDVFPYKQEL